MTDSSGHKEGEVRGIIWPCYMLHPVPNWAKVLYLQSFLCSSNLPSVQRLVWFWFVGWGFFCVVCKQNKINFLARGFEDKLAHEVRK